MDKGVIFNQIDILDIVQFVTRKNKRFQATMLKQIENIMKDREEYSQVRKVLLDGMNNYTRSILKTFLGGVEDI